MLTMDVNHPDVKQFITSKDDITKITGANISVKITNKFMKDVRNFETFPMANMKQKEIWNKIVHQAWKSAEPGVLFWDKIIKESPADCYEGFKTVSTNPCGELPLCAYDSCRLSSMNLYGYVKNPFTKHAEFDWNLFEADVKVAQRMMDNIIDLEAEKIDRILSKISSDPEPFDIKFHEINLWTKIKTKLLQGRRTGLGITAMADALAALGLTYGTEEANKMAVEMIKRMSIASYQSSITMARERGAFPIWSLKKEQDNPFINRIINELDYNDPDDDKYYDLYPKYGRRNIANLTIAPNGSISLLTQTSSGLEPVFNLTYKRKRKTEDGEEEYEVVHPKYADEFAKGISGRSAYKGATANEIDPISKIKMQGKIQKWIDHSISITHNLPENITEETVADIYMKAWEAGCKGCTVYREGSRAGVLINERKHKFIQTSAPKRPKSLTGEAFTTSVKGEKFTVVIGLLDNKPYEVFAFQNGTIKGEGNIVKHRKGDYEFVLSKDDSYKIINDVMTDEQAALTRMTSTALRHGADIMHIVEQLNKTEGDITSFSKAISRVLKRYITNQDIQTNSECPECKTNSLAYQEGCVKCKNCGFTKC